jgi:transcriptional regulator GlxA family with amidase domain
VVGNIDLVPTAQALFVRMSQYPRDVTSQKFTRTRRVGFLIFPERNDRSLRTDRRIRERHLLAGWPHSSAAGIRNISGRNQARPGENAGGLQFVADYGFEEAIEETDTLVVSGSPWIKKVCEDEALVEWLKNIAPSARRIVSVCNWRVLARRRRSPHEPRSHDPLDERRTV